MVASITNARKSENCKFILRVHARGAMGPDLFNAPQVKVMSKAEAKAYCKANGLTPWNF